MTILPTRRQDAGQLHADHALTEYVVLTEYVDDRLRDLCAQLAARHHPTEVCVELAWGEPDVRVRVRGPRRNVVVELLVDRPGAPVDEHWAAVRDEGGRREVWRGPTRPCPDGGLLCFVEDLLQLDAARLAERFTDLG